MGKKDLPLIAQLIFAAKMRVPKIQKYTAQVQMATNQISHIKLEPEIKTTGVAKAIKLALKGISQK
jgi:hypothetical protein